MGRLRSSLFHPACCGELRLHLVDIVDSAKYQQEVIDLAAKGRLNLA